MAVTEKGEREWKKENSKDEVTFKVVDVNNRNRIVWGPRAQGSDKWTNWALRFDTSGEVVMNVPNDGKTYAEGGYINVKCQDKQIEKGERLRGPGKEVTVYAEKLGEGVTNILKVEIDRGQCTEEDNEGKEECDIKLASGLNLRQENSMFL